MDDKTSKDEVLWAIGGRNSTDCAHAYLSKEDMESGKCLCGRTVKAHLQFEHWDLKDPLVLEHTCPQCKERLKLLKYR